MARRFQIPARYRKLAFCLVIFIGLLIGYLSLGQTLSGVGATVIQGEKVSLWHLWAALLWLMAAWLAIMALNLFVWENIIYRQTGNPVPQLLKSTANLIILIIVLIFIVAFVFHKSITGLLATTGAFGLVLGLSLRGILENAAQGISLNIAQVFKPGDVISIPGKFDEQAVVKDITMRNTYLQDFVGHVVAIPNSVICANVIRNYSHAKTFSVCFSIVIGVRGLSILDALRILNAVIASMDFVVEEPPHQVFISNIETDKVTYDLSCWMERDKITPIQAKHLLYIKITEQLAAAGFVVGSPFIDYDEIEKRMAVVFHQLDRISHLQPEEREAFFEYELTDHRTRLVLNKVSLFSNLNPIEIEDLSGMMKTLYYEAGETLLQQGDVGDGMYILVEGVLQIYVKSTEQEKLIPVAKLTPGHYFGELSLLVGEPRSATVLALSDVMVYEISKKTMVNLFEKHPDIIKKISDKIAEQQLININKQHEYSEPEAEEKKRDFAMSFMKRISKFFGMTKPG